MDFDRMREMILCLLNKEIWATRLRVDEALDEGIRAARMRDLEELREVRSAFIASVSGGSE